ncbi:MULTISPECIES: cold shock domain-containing protein [unclassified Sphingomonas]|jgi:cold shock protein|uniref:cold-shock protein n=1 Tax=unclassified Sphingomonas TaxID=196159 RepID=UPI0010F8AF7B|nr:MULTISPECIES: cold shock domain-containing protein [unclassified Sphingomonas]
MLETGKVKWYNEFKGLGFITPDSGGEDVPFRLPVMHAAGIETLAEGQRLAFEARMGNRGLEAVSIRLA